MEFAGERPGRFLDGCGSRSAAGRSLLVKHLGDCLLRDATREQEKRFLQPPTQRHGAGRRPLQ